MKLKQVFERLNSQGIELNITNTAKDWLGKKGYDPNLGARPMRRLIQTKLLDTLALNIIDGKIQSGSTVDISIKNNKLSFKY